MRVEEADVVVVGAGPVGLTLAIDLAGRGIKVVVAETRARMPKPPSVKCNHVAARSMEQYRRLGIVAKVRDAGLPADYPNDVVFRTTVTGIELTRIPIPCRAERYTSKEGPDTDWPTPEPPHRINQLYFEPILLAHAASLPNIALHHRTRVDGFEQVGAGARTPSVAVAATDLDSGDGGRSCAAATWSAATAAARRCASRSARASKARRSSSASSRPTSARRASPRSSPASARGRTTRRTRAAAARCSRSTGTRPG